MLHAVEPGRGTARCADVRPLDFKRHDRLSSNSDHLFSSGRAVSLTFVGLLVLAACGRGVSDAAQSGWTSVGGDSVVRETDFAEGPLTNITRCWKTAGGFDCIAVRRSAPPQLTVSRYQTSDLNAPAEPTSHFACDFEPAPDEWYRQIVYGAPTNGQSRIIAQNSVLRIGAKTTWSGRYVQDLLETSGFSPDQYINCPVLYDVLLRGGVKRLLKEDFDPSAVFDAR